MRYALFAFFVFGLFAAAIVDVGGGTDSHQVIVKTGEKITVVNVSEDSASLGLVNEKGENVVMDSGGGMPAASAQVQAVEITPSDVVADGKKVADGKIRIQAINTSMAIVKEQNRIFVSDPTASAEIKTALKYQEQALISTQSNKEIKVSPSVAIEAVPAQAQIKNIELIDDGTAPAYRIHAVSNRRRMFFLIPVEMEINYKIDATNGKVLSEEKPWWSFLVWG